MKKEKIDEMWRKAKERDKRDEEKLRSLSQEERERLQNEAENSRLWEDWSDVVVTPLKDGK